MNALIGHRAAAVSGCTVEQSLSLPCLAGDKQGVYRVEQVLDGSLAVALGGCESSLERRTRKSPTTPWLAATPTPPTSTASSASKG